MLRDNVIAELLGLAREKGALAVAAIPAARVVVDPRVRLKCQVPLCPNYGVNLMCPPNVAGVEEFAAALAGYRDAILLQVAIELPETVPVPGYGDLQDVYKGRAYERVLVEASRRLAEIVRAVEAKALVMGCHFAAGLTAGSCRLCDECVTVRSGQPCRLPFRARPAMEAVGIDVVGTAAAAGLEVTFSEPGKARWTGLVLVD